MHCQPGLCSGQKVKGVEEEEYITASGREDCPELAALYKQGAGTAERRSRHSVMEGSF